MTHPQEQNSEWIEHAGGKCPVDDFDIVEVRTAKGFTARAEAWALLWQNVTSYRLHTPTPSSQGDAQ